MTTNTPAARAAELLRREASALRECHTIDGSDWSGEDDAKAAHDEMLAVAASLSPASVGAEPAAFMWQHDETGRIGFVDPWQVENGWQQANPRLKIVEPLYRNPATAASTPSPAAAVGGGGEASMDARQDWAVKEAAVKAALRRANALGISSTDAIRIITWYEAEFDAARAAQQGGQDASG